MYPPFSVFPPESVQDAAPLTGANVAVSSSSSLIALNPAGTLAALTITFPAAPSNGQTVTICTTQIITALTLAGGTFIGGITTLALGGFASFCYITSQARWVRCG